MAASDNSAPNLPSFCYRDWSWSMLSFGITTSTITGKDGVGGTIKQRVFRDVKSGKVSITNAEHFAAHAGAILNGIKSLYMPIDEVLEEPEDIEKSSPRIDGN